MPRLPGRFDHGFVSEHYDVIIVGSGAGGGTLAHTLAPSGKRSTCIRCTWCDGYPCLVHAKSDAEVIGAVNPALTAMASAIRVGEHLLDRIS